MSCPIFESIKRAKDGDKHLIIIDALINQGITFIEQAEFIYQLTTKNEGTVTWYIRTNILRITAYGKSNDVKLTSFEQLVHSV